MEDMEYMYFFPSSSIYSDRTKAVIFCTGAYITMLVSCYGNKAAYTLYKHKTA